MGEKYEVYKNNEHDCIHWNIYGRLFTRAEKRNYIFYTRENKDTKEDAPVEKQEQEKNEESQAIQTNEQVEHKQEEVSSDEKKEETTPVHRLSNQCKIMNKK